MLRLLTLFAVLLLATATLSMPVQAQHRVVRPQLRAPQQPRAFSRQHQQRAFRKTRSRTRAHTVRPRQVSPRFYGSNSASRATHRPRTTRRYRAAPRVSVPRRVLPRFYGAPSAARASQHLRSRARARVIRQRQQVPRRSRPTFWK